MRCFLIDDFPIIFETISRYIQDTPGLELIGQETNPLRAIEDLLSGKVVPDVVFLDIEMPGINGIEVAEQLRGKIPVIFLSGNDHYGPQAFNVDAIDYLSKPVRYERFLEAINRLLLRQNLPLLSYKNEFEAGLNSIIVPGTGKGAWEKIRYQDIVYLKSVSNYIDIFLINGKVCTYGSLKKFEARCPKNTFLRIQRSYIVNTNHIIKGDQKDIVMANGDVLPIGDLFKDEVKKYVMGNDNIML